MALEWEQMLRSPSWGGSREAMIVDQDPAVRTATQDALQSPGSGRGDGSDP